MDDKKRENPYPYNILENLDNPSWRDTMWNIQAVKRCVDTAVDQERERNKEKRLLTMCPKCKLVFNARYDWKEAGEDG